MHKPNIEVRSLNHFCRGNAMIITYSERVSVALVTRHAKCMLRILVCSLRGSKLFPHYLINGTIFGKHLLNINVCLDILYICYLKHLSLQEEVTKLLSQMYMGLHVQYLFS